MGANGSINAKYLARLARKDWFRNIQAPYYEQVADFINPKIKSHYTRYFDATSTNIHFIENGCALLQSPLINAEQIELLEQRIEHTIGKVIQQIEADIARAQQLMDANAVQLDAKFFQDPLSVAVKILSPLGFQYLDALQKADHLILCLESVRLRGIIKRTDCDKQIARIDHGLKSIQRCAFELAVGLRNRVRITGKGEDSTSNASAPEQEILEPSESGLELVQSSDQDRIAAQAARA
jgi:hypothetical protein